jgi:S1-C subfamily serine protease
MPEPILLSTTRVSTFVGSMHLTAATGFFFARNGALYLVTSRHVLHDPPSGHEPDRIEIVLHVGGENLQSTAAISMPLYRDGRAVWRQGADSAGDVDVAVLPIPGSVLPAGAVWSAFGPEHVAGAFENVQVGAELMVVGFPLGFFDTLHQLPVARHAIVASAFGVRFQGKGCFLTDGRLHRGTSGAPVVTRDDTLGPLAWRLLGVHSSRVDMSSRDGAQDETLGLNTAWYADILMVLTDEGSGQAGQGLPASAGEMPLGQH